MPERDLFLIWSQKDINNTEREGNKQRSYDEIQTPHNLNHKQKWKYILKKDLSFYRNKLDILGNTLICFFVKIFMRTSSHWPKTGNVNVLVGWFFKLFNLYKNHLDCGLCILVLIFRYLRFPSASYQENVSFRQNAFTNFSQCSPWLGVSLKIW